MLPLVERHAEIAALDAAIASARAGVGSVVCLYGEGGIGKTRLAREAVSMARAAGMACAWGETSSDGGVPPLWPWQSVLSQLGCDDASVALESVSPSIVNEVGPQRFNQFRTAVDALSRAAARQPILVVFDDAHAGDPGALLLARFAVRSMRAVPAMIVIAARDTGEVDPDVRAVLDDIARDGTLLKPASLSSDALAALIRPGNGAELADGQLAQVVGLTRGVPLFVQELLTSRAIGSTITVESVRTLLEARLRQLDTRQRHVVAVVALLGSTASLSLVGVVSALRTDDVDAALRAAEIAGIIVRDGHSARFSHDLLAEAAIESLSADERATAHDRAATALYSYSAINADRLAGVARHRLAAASLWRTRESVRDAGEAARAATAHLVAGAGYETASQLLRHAVALYDDIGATVPVRLLLDTARSELSAGKLREARAWFRRAADAAGHADERAEAAIGFGGIWVAEHRQTSEHAVYMGMIDTALSLLDGTPGHELLGIRLRARRAAELVYLGLAPISEVRAEVEAARRSGSALVQAEALSLLHHTMLGPASAHERRAVADELLRASTAAGDNMLALMGMLWRSVDLALLGDPRADRALNELREQADALQVGAVLFVVRALDVMQLVRRGRLDEAATAAQQCFQLGSDIGDADAVGYLGAHMLTIRWLQLRPDEMLPLARGIADSPMMVDGDVAYPAAVAVLAAMTGEFDEANVALERVMRQLPRSVQTSSNWMISMFCAAEAAALLGDAAASRTIYDHLAPFADLPIMGSIGVVCFGSAERTLGVAARAFGDVDAAARHFERAVVHNHRLGNAVMAAISEGEHGLALMDRARTDLATRDDLARGSALVEAAVDAMGRLGLHERATALRAASVHAAADDIAPVGEFVQRGTVWELRIGDQTVELADTVGVQRLLHLLERPFVDIPATDLVGSVEDGGRHELADRQALRAYHERAQELRADIDAAADDNDFVRADRLRDELDALLDHLRSSEALAGRSRAFADGHERARIAVRKSLSRVFDEVSQQAPQIAEDLAASIRTGSTCRFHPRHRFPSVWRRRAHAD